MRIAICDDDITFMGILTKRLYKLFEKRGIAAQVSCHDTPQSLYNEVAAHPDAFDLFFLDIEMPGMRGTALSRELRRLDPACLIIFITAFDSEVYNAFHYRADGFVPKTKLDERLPGEIDLILENRRMAKLEGPIFFNVETPRQRGIENKELLIRLRSTEILFFENNYRNLTLHALDATYTVKRLDYKEVRSEFLQRGFFLTHRSYLVNPIHIKAVARTEVILFNGIEVPLSRPQRENIVNQFMGFMDK